MKIGLISDLHLREKMPYADLVKDGREGEVEMVLNHIVRAFSNCDAVVFMGDNLNSRINSAGTIARFVNLLERFGDDKAIYIIAGNHEKMSDGSSALDFIAELTGKTNWVLVSRYTKTINVGDVNIALMPYFHRTETQSVTTEDWQKSIDKQIDMIQADILLVHHSIAGCGVSDYVSTDSFSEPVLNRQTLEDKFKMVVGGHIHKATDDGKIHVLGNVFNSEIGEYGKRVGIIDTDTMTLETVNLPGKHIVKVIDPQPDDALAVMAEHGTGAIVKVEVKTERTPEELAVLKAKFQSFESLIFTERYSNKREKTHVEGGVEELGIETLLKNYAKAKDINVGLLTRAMELIS